MTSVAAGGPPRADARALFDGREPGVLGTWDEARGTFTYILPGAPTSTAGARAEPLTVRVPTSVDAAPRVQHEAMLLVELRRRRLGSIERTIPRHVGVCQYDGLPVAVASVLPGRPMRVDAGRWMRGAPPARVRLHFQYATDWLSRFQEASTNGSSPTTWVAEVIDALSDRMGPQPGLAASLAAAMDRLDGHQMERTAVHGDFGQGNLLVDEAGISGVLNWAGGAAEGWPLRDLVRFALRYSQHLGQPKRPGRRVARHSGARRVGSAPGIRYALLGAGWYPRTVRAYLREGLERLGIPADLWYHAGLVGIAEMAAQCRDERAAGELLAVLADVPAPPRRPGLVRLT